MMKNSPPNKLSVKDFENEDGSINSEKFYDFVYTPLGEALKEIERRRKDPDLKAKIESSLNGIPEPLLEGVCAVLFRQVASPQFEMKRFFDITTGFGLNPLFLEYHSDKFTSNNKFKYSLAKLCIYKGKGKNGCDIIQNSTVIDFVKYDGKRLSEVEIFNGKSLIDFHHQLFERIEPSVKKSFYDISHWLHNNGLYAQEYYKSVLSLFICHGILFENFIVKDFNVNKSDLAFTKEVVLPAFLFVLDKFGFKPLIVPLDPTDIENDHFWCSYPEHIKDML